MGTSTQLTLVAAVRASGNVALVIPLPLWVGQAAVDPSPIPAWLRLCTHSKFDGGQPEAGCLTPQLRTNGRLADGMKGRESVRKDATCPNPVAAPG